MMYINLCKKWALLLQAFFKYYPESTSAQKYYNFKQARIMLTKKKEGYWITISLVLILSYYNVCVLVTNVSHI